MLYINEPGVHARREKHGIVARGGAASVMQPFITAATKCSWSASCGGIISMLHVIILLLGLPIYFTNENSN